MDITLDKKNATEASIKIIIKEGDYQPKVEEKVKEYSKKANLKGFRKGKVPKGVIQKMYGKSIMVDVINQILSNSIRDYIKEKDLKIIGDPVPDIDKTQKIDWENQKEFEFNYDIGLVDDFTINLSKIKVKSYNIEPDKKSIEETIENLRKQHGKMTNPEVSEEDDHLYGTIKQLDGDINKEGLLETDKMEKKQKKKFIGLTKDDKVVFNLTDAFKDVNYISSLLEIPEAEVNDIEGKFEFTLKNVNRKEEADLNQEFFDKILGKDQAKTIEEFKEKIKKELARSYDRESEYYLESTIKDTLTEKTKMELPNEFLKKWLYHSNEGKVTKDDIEKEFDSYVKELKWTLIKNKIAEDNGIKVEHEDVIERTKDIIRQQFGGQNITPEIEQNLDSFANNYLQAQEGENYMKVYNQTRSEKIFNMIKENITVSRKNVKPDEFQKIVKG